MTESPQPDATTATPAVSLIEGLMTTRAMRRLRPDPIPDPVLWDILAAANQAPSGGNIQPWQFMMITSPEVRAQLADLYRACYDRYETAMLPTRRPPADEAAAQAWERTVAASRHLAEHFGDVPAIAVVLAADIDLTISDDRGPLDIGSILGSVFPAVQNVMLAARAHGIGTALTTVLRIEQQQTRDLLGIPDRWQVVAVIPMGYPVGRFGVAPRKPVEKVTHWDRFGERRSRPSGT